MSSPDKQLFKILGLDSLRDALDKVSLMEDIHVPPEAAAFFVSLLFLHRKKIVFLIHNPALVETRSLELKTFLGEERVFEYPDFEAMPHEHLRVVHGHHAKRLAALDAMSRGKDCVVVAPARSLLRRLPPLSSYMPLSISVSKGDQIEFERFIENLVSFGYEKSDLVESPGHFAVRGGIIDVYPTFSELPVRIEFFGDNVESIRFFDPESQLSIGSIDSFEIAREKETPLTDEELIKCAEELQEPTRTALLNDVEKRNSLMSYWPLLYDSLDSFMDYLNRDIILVFDDIEKVKKELKKFHSEFEEICYRGLTAISEPGKYFLTPDTIEERLLDFDGLNLTGFSVPPELIFEALPKPGFKDSLTFLLPYLKKATDAYVLCGHDVKPEKVAMSTRRFFQEEFLTKFHVSPGFLERGFYWPHARTAYLPASYFLGSRIVLSIIRSPVKKKYEEIMDVTPGDLVVHTRYGVGRYLGVAKELRGEIERELLVIEYADGKLKIPVEQIEKVSRYKGPTESAVIDKLASPEWGRARERAKKAARKLAFDLVKVYAKREISKREPYDVSNSWIQEFESLFPYDETEDQTSAIYDIYSDLSREEPAERLIIGDVGFGKTEVAMRAAFASVVSGKKSMIICPTTVLAEQHYETWRERFASFPIVIEMVSRFRSPSEKRRIIERFNEGKIDILIGTHTVLSKKIDFEGVGLVIVDEEHLFGVNQKEYFKSRKPNVDMIFLSATPIPRTLQLALTGVRDISIIETPPPGRLPIITHIGLFDEELIKVAMERELGREGQALYVLNKISALPSVRDFLAKILPGARIEIAHGQMRERELERVMVEFWRGDIDVLVTTTIVESGLDMPLVNTLIVDGAEMLGLAQAYQLRGRIGRSYRQAFSYFLYRSLELTEEAKRRLSALLELSDLGAGFKLAIKDLEIRGAGNILGPEQHGHISRIGLELFLEILRREIDLLKGRPIKGKEAEVTIDLPVSIRVPDDYAGSLKMKYEIYKKASRIRTVEDQRELKNELIDRFGSLPEPVINLLDLALIKNLAADAGVKTIKYKKGILSFAGPSIKPELRYEIGRLSNAQYSLGKLLLRVDEREASKLAIWILVDIIALLFSRKEN